MPCTFCDCGVMKLVRSITDVISLTQKVLRPDCVFQDQDLIFLNFENRDKNEICFKSQFQNHESGYRDKIET